MSDSAAEPTERRSRARYLLDGRRVRLADLLSNGLLKEGERLTFVRPLVGDTHHATVTAKGWIRLDDGEEFRSPSKAAAVAVGRGSFDGWTAWAVTDGRPLATLRQQLLDQAAEEADPDTAEEQQTSVAPSERHARLKRARELAEAGQPQSLSVEELLTWWGATGRGLVNEQIEAELANHSLVTAPGFDKVPLASTIQLVKAAEGNSAEGLVAGAPAFTTASDEDESRETGLTVGTLPSALGGVISVKPTATFEEAITLMALHDFSQLPVLAGPHNLRGALSWKSIARARHADPDASLSQAIVDARDVRYDHDLIDILPALAELDFVLVKDHHNAIAGIVTAADVAQAYGDLASHFLLIGEMDRRLRQVIAGTFTLSEVTGLCDPAGERVTSFGDMTVGDYLRLLENPDRWQQLGWPLDRKVFIGRLEEIRRIRNNVMHFNSSDPLPRADVDKIRNLNKLLREYGGSS
ncbi:CBS domain-containing protein [Streptomyces sp. RB6PN25]|uniref:CBS domain-containing protein n=1 Tax=Streptomyces humicola TaxID=2953240 RepID=A0ABT1Q220_9ACTN|nr:CBS domain-containing protein [Streptomyces humicola]MCQ4083987.1 CBS domain-containing protein [Streptomyces humicola]